MLLIKFIKYCFRLFPTILCSQSKFEMVHLKVDPDNRTEKKGTVNSLDR